MPKGLSVATLAAGLAIASSAQAAQTVKPDKKPTAVQAAAIKQAVEPDMRDSPFTVGAADLNGDKKPDLIAQIQDTLWCGSAGCSGVAVLARPGGYASKAIDLANFRDHVTVLDTVHNQMHDLRFDDARYVFRWNGKAYQ